MKLVTVAFLLTALCSVPAQGAESPYKIRIGFPSLAFSYMPFYVAQEKGIYKKYGLESEYIQMATGIQPQAVVAGNINYLTSVSAGIPRRLPGSRWSSSSASATPRPGCWLLTRTSTNHKT